MAVGCERRTAQVGQDSALIRKVACVRSSNSLRARMARGVVWLACGSLGMQATALLGSVVCARILGESRFGEFGIVRSTLLMLGVLAGSGMGVVATKYVAEYRDTDRECAGRMIGLLLTVAVFGGGGIGVLCLLLASPVATWGMKTEHLVLSLRIGFLLPMLYSLGGVQLGVLAGLESFRSVAWLNALDGVLVSGCAIVGARIGDVNGAMLGLSIAATVSAAVKHTAMTRHCSGSGIRVSRPTSPTDWPALWRGALPAIVLGLVFFPCDWCARLLLSRQPGGFAELGIFTAAYAWGQTVLFLPAHVVGPTQSIFANLLGAGQVRSFRRLVRLTVASAIALALLTAVILSWWSGRIMAIYGGAFVDGGKVLLVIALAHVFYAATMPFKNILITLDRIWDQAFHHCILGGALLGSAIVLGRHGALGLAFAHLFAWSAMFVWQGVVIARAMKHFRGRTR